MIDGGENARWSAGGGTAENPNVTVSKSVTVVS